VIDTLRMHLDFRNIWQQQSVNRRIFVALITVGGFTFMANLLAAGKELVVAYQFGTADVLDALLIAFLLPSFAINVVAGSFNAAFIPTFIWVRENQGSEKAQKVFSSVMVWNTTMLLIVSIVLALTVSLTLPILGSGFSKQKLELTRSLFFILLPILVINGFSMIWAALLNASERFALPAISLMMRPTITVAILLAMGKAWGIYALAVGTAGGFLLEAGLLAWGLMRQGIHIIPHWFGLDPAMKKVIKQYIPMVAGALLMSSTSLVNQTMAAMLGPGSVSAFNYGTRVVTLVLGIGSISLSTAVFPHFSRMVGVNDWSGVRHTLKTYSFLIVFLAVPLTVALIYFSEPLARLFFERGAFTSEDTYLVSRVQGLFLLQVPFYFLSILIGRLISSLQANHILLKGAVISLPLSVVLNYLFIQWLGVAGIALANSIVYFVSFCYLLYMLLGLIKEYFS